MISFIWLIAGIYFDIKGQMNDLHEQSGWIIGLMATMIVDCIFGAITIKIFPHLLDFLK